MCERDSGRAASPKSQFDMKENGSSHMSCGVLIRQFQRPGFLGQAHMILRTCGLASLAFHNWASAL